jgi:mannose-6-phosphate isomerase-like protein (cupin superfamily)
VSRAYLSGDHQQLEWVGGSVMEVLLDSEATEGSLFLARTRLKAGDAAPVHMHTAEDEMFLILSGRGVFFYGDDELLAEEGSVVYLPRNVPHGYHFLTDVDLLTFCTPAGAEQFFRTAGHDLATPKPADWQLTPATMAAAAAATGLQILGPPRKATQQV